MSSDPLDALDAPAGTAGVGPARWDGLVPRAGVRVQLCAAALTWAVGAGFLLGRGVLLSGRPGEPFSPEPWLLPMGALGIAIGVLKARFVLVPYARRAVERIRVRGRACLLGFFAPSSWAFITVMMGTGILLRHSALADLRWGRMLLCGLYLAVGTALLAADGVLMAALRESLVGALAEPVADPPSA